MLVDLKHVFIIEAEGREPIYYDIGYDKFPLTLTGWKAVMKFGAPASVLVAAQEKLKALPLPPSVTETPEAHSFKDPCWQYEKYVGMGAALLGVGLFAYRLYKGNVPAEISHISTIKPS